MLVSTGRKVKTLDFWKFLIKTRYFETLHEIMLFDQNNTNYVRLYIVGSNRYILQNLSEFWKILTKTTRLFANIITNYVYRTNKQLLFLNYTRLKLT